MANLTLTIDDAVLLRARQRALANGTSVNAIVREYLDSYAGSDAASEALAAFVAGAQRSAAGSGPGGRTWTRDSLHDRG